MTFERKHYLDNLRIICILMLFPYHTAMVYNTFESFYIHTPIKGFPDAFIMINWVWIMPIMFVIAGVSAFHSFKSRGWKAYTRERVFRLFIPLIFGILTVVPIQTYFSERFHNAYEGGYFEQYALFFTKIGDLTGYNGGFTPAQLWFILYLFIISILAIPLILLINKKGFAHRLRNLKFFIILLLFVIPFVLQPILDIGGKSLGEYFTLFILGYTVLSSDEVTEKLEKHWLGLSISALVILLVNYTLYGILKLDLGILLEIIQSFLMWVCVLALLGVGKRFLNFSNRFTAYFNRASFPIYIFHQSWLVAISYYTVKFINNTILQVCVIIFGSFVATIITYEIIKRVPVIRALFGIKIANRK